MLRRLCSYLLVELLGFNPRNHCTRASRNIIAAYAESETLEAYIMFIDGLTQHAEAEDVESQELIHFANQFIRRQDILIETLGYRVHKANRLWYAFLTKERSQELYGWTTRYIGRLTQLVLSSNQDRSRFLKALVKTRNLGNDQDQLMTLNNIQGEA